MITQKQLKEAWGVTQAAISGWQKKGCPMTTIDEATAWRMRTFPKFSNPSAKFLACVDKVLRDAPESPLPADVAPPIEEPKAADIKREDALGRVARARKTEMVAYQVLAMAVNKGQQMSLQSLTRNWREAAKSVSDAELELLEWQRASGRLIDAEQAKEIFKRYLGEIRSLLDALPSSAASRCNPSDPELAKASLTEAVHQILSTINKARGEFK